MRKQYTQETMEAEIKKLIGDVFTEGMDHIYDRMCLQFVSCSSLEQTLTVRYPVQDWELNHMSTMHGGLIATAMDTTSGLLTLFLSEGSVIPTINMTINYISPAVKGDDLLITAKADRVGQHLVNISAFGHGESSQKIIATAMVSFMMAGK